METLIIEMPAIIKAKTDEGGRRLVEVESSNEQVDSEGDVILQSALLDAAPSFVKSGNLDIDHISEIGHRYGIRDTSSYIIGRPTEVKDIGSGRTSVVGEIMRSRDGVVDTKKNKYDEFWMSLMADPPVNWRASIYGFPTADGIIDCSKSRSNGYGATRYLVKGISWKSLAFTTNPVNDAITGTARILTQKAFFEIMKARVEKNYDLGAGATAAPMNGPIVEKTMLSPRNREELLGHYYGHMCKGACLFANSTNGMSVFTFRQHFANCCMEPEHSADLLALALMQLLKHEKRTR